MATTSVSQMREIDAAKNRAVNSILTMKYITVIGQLVER